MPRSIYEWQEILAEQSRTQGEIGALLLKELINYRVTTGKVAFSEDAQQAFNFALAHGTKSETPISELGRPRYRTQTNEPREIMWACRYLNTNHKSGVEVAMMIQDAIAEAAGLAAAKGVVTVENVTVSDCPGYGMFLTIKIEVNRYE